MKYEAVTIKDIAKTLGLSTSTVSRALRDSYEISAETKLKVLEYAQQINYKPNPIALSLKEKKSRTIGVIVCEIANSFFSQVINGIESIANKKGYNVIIAQSLESAERELTDLQFLTSRSVDGIIISLAASTKDFSVLNELKEKGMPLVFFDRIVNEIDTHKIIVDNFMGAYEATKHLIEKGHRKIAAIAGAEGLSITKERLAGYKKALADYTIIDMPKDFIQYCAYGGMNVNEVEDAVNKFLCVTEKPTAILATSDKLTTGCMRVLNAKAIQIPREIALIGFSNNDLTEMLSPALSVVRQPAYEMGVTAMEILLETIESKRPVTNFETRKLSTQLIARAST